MAADALQLVQVPTLLIVGGDDEPVIGLNRWVLAILDSQEMERIVLPGATLLFGEPGAREEVA